MSELSKQALVVDNNQSFPNNNNGAITPSILRAFNTNIIDSTVNQTQYTTDSGSWNVSASLSLTTASFNTGTRNLTFTKGNGTTFNVNIPDVSGSIGNFATTGSNTFNGDQTISGSILLTGNVEMNKDVNAGILYPMDGGKSIRIQKQVGINRLAWVDQNNDKLLYLDLDTDEFLVSGSLKAGLQNGYAWVGQPDGYSAQVATSSFASTINTGSFATTGSNTFVGEQRIYNNQSLRFANNGTFSGDSGSRLSADSNTGMQFRNFSNNAMYFEQYGTSSLDFYNYNGTIGITGSTTTIQGVNFIPFSASLDARILAITGSGGTINTGSFATTGSNNFFGVESINDPNLAGIGIGQGEVYLLARSGSLILGNSVSTPTYAALSHLSSSQINANTNLIFKDNSLTGDTIISGSGNIFTNPASPGVGRKNYIGGSTNLFLNGQSDQLPTITGSAASVSGNRPTMNANYIAGTHAWTINQAVNPGAHTYNNNILAGAGTWTFNTLGNTGAINVSQNLGLSSALTLNSPSRSIAQINAGESGSNALIIQNNTIAGTLNYNGPVSSSTHFIQQNTIAGFFTLNAQSSSRGINMAANIINGTMTMNDNTVFAPTLGSNNGISNNNINGGFVLNQRASSSVNMSNNNINTWTVSNDMDASAITNANLRFLGLAGNVLFGAGNNNIYASGSAPAINSQRAFASNIFGGTFMSASVVANGTDANMVATIGVGHGLNIVGTARRDASNTTGAGATQGSAFFGRYNKEGQGFNTTADVILAVGTGTSGSAGIVRKTGFLIDSGSNTFVEGTLNISGSTTLSGSLYIQSASAFPTQIGTSLVTWDATTGQVGQATTSTLISSSFSAGEFYSMTTLSGSSGVSASIELPNTAISNGVSIQSNSQIVVQNTGVYNIQFSAQADAFGGADTIWIWFKKNGTNIADSASKLIMQNNTAAIMTVNIFDNALPNDYFEVVWQNNAGAGKLISDAATGNIPGIPSVIVTVNQVK
jgi:hypothetical protein